MHEQYGTAARRGSVRPSNRPTMHVYWDGDRPVGHLFTVPTDHWNTVAEKLASMRVPRDAASDAAVSSTRPLTADVVICTRDRPAELERCLASLPLQSRPPNRVIVVDNASIDTATREIALAAGAHYLREDRPGLDIARNTGLMAATSDLVAYTDDDTELHPRWLEKLTAAFDTAEVRAVCGLVLPAELAFEAQWVFETRYGFGKGYERADFDRDYYLSTRRKGTPVWDIGAGANMAFRRTVRESVGLFDERLDVGAAGCSGDSEYWYRVLWSGGVCRYEPNVVVFHHHRRGMEELRGQMYHYMRGHVAALLVQHERTRDRGNLYRAFLTLPRHYLWRWRHRSSEDLCLAAEVRGVAAGFAYYLRTCGGAEWRAVHRARRRVQP